MSKKQSNVFKQLITIVLTAIILTITVTPAFAKGKAKAPALNSTAVSIVIGKSFNFNIYNLPKKATYQWEIGNVNVATVDKAGVVTGVKKGKTTITCRAKIAGKYTRIVASVTVLKPAIKVTINNKIETIKVGEYCDLNVDVIPASSNDKMTWTSSDKTIAKPEFNGFFKALKVGTVTITCTSVSGRTDSVTIKVTN